MAELREILPPDTALAFEAMRALRTHHADQDEFVRRVDEDQRPQGYRMVGALETIGAHPAEPGASATTAGASATTGRVVAVAGFRVLHNLAWGDALYVDDLSTLPEARGRGYGAALLDWCAQEAERLGCGQLHLDSGVDREREDAHRLYFNQRLRIVGYHFARRL